MIEGLMNDVVTIAAWTGTTGGCAPSYGTAVTTRARVEPYTRMVRGADGDLHQAHARVYLPAGTAVLTDSQVTLPDGTAPEVLDIKRIKGMAAEHHVEVVL